MRAAGSRALDARATAPAHLADYIRGQWSVENQFHWRDATFREDTSRRIRPRSHSRIMATLRNPDAGPNRQAGYTTIAATIRQLKHDTALLLAVLGLHSPT